MTLETKLQQKRIATSIRFADVYPLSSPVETLYQISHLSWKSIHLDSPSSPCCQPKWNYWLPECCYLCRCLCSSNHVIHQSSHHDVQRWSHLRCFLPIWHQEFFRWIQEISTLSTFRLFYIREWTAKRFPKQETHMLLWNNLINTSFQDSPLQAKGVNCGTSDVQI